MSRERWTVEFEVEVSDGMRSIWSHVNGKMVATISNTDDGLLDGMDDGLHWHANMSCSGLLLPWRLIRREPLGGEKS